MNVPVWAYELARHFWETVGEEHGFPREFENAIESGYPLAVKRVRKLTLASIHDVLVRLGIPFDHADDRSLRGCLAASNGNGLIFIDADDPFDEQRFSLAHELAHFLRDVWRPRQQVIRVSGEQATQVLDGRRRATQDERFSATLADLDLSPNLHLLPRDPDGQAANRAIAVAEESADDLAFELLAPASHVARCAGEWSDEELVAHLAADYGIPGAQAARYAKRLRPQPPTTDVWLALLRTTP